MHFCLLVGQIYLEQLQNYIYCKSSFSNTVFIIIVSGAFLPHFGVVLHSVYHLDHRIVGEELTVFYSNCSLQFLVLLFNNNSLFCCYFVVFSPGFHTDAYSFHVQPFILQKLVLLPVYVVVGRLFYGEQLRIPHDQIAKCPT